MSEQERLMEMYENGRKAGAALERARIEAILCTCKGMQSAAKYPGGHVSNGCPVAKLYAAPAPEPPAPERCGHRSDQGLTCGMAKGHQGNHNALAWAVNPPPDGPL